MSPTTNRSIAGNTLDALLKGYKVWPIRTPAAPQSSITQFGSGKEPAVYLRKGIERVHVNRISDRMDFIRRHGADQQGHQAVVLIVRPLKEKLAAVDEIQRMELFQRNVISDEGLQPVLLESSPLPLPAKEATDDTEF